MIYEPVAFLKKKTCVFSQITSSTHSSARALYSSKTTVGQVLHNNGQHSFHFQRVQELNAEDFQRRVELVR